MGFLDAGRAPSIREPSIEWTTSSSIWPGPMRLDLGQKAAISARTESACLSKYSSARFVTICT